jgi:hypothetical protein
MRQLDTKTLEEQIMRMELSLDQRLEQRLELHLDLRQELQNQVMDLAPEFKDLITFEEDDDFELLKEAFPFMILHELSHPLYTRSQIHIPKIKLPKEVKAMITSDPYISSHIVSHHAIEIGVDRSAILIGQKSAGYTEEESVQSNIALIKRVYRDIFDTKRIDPEYGLIARLDAELKIYDQMEFSKEIKQNIAFLRDISIEHIKSEIPEFKELYMNIVSAYEKIYKGTNIEQQQDSKIIPIENYLGVNSQF